MYTVEGIGKLGRLTEQSRQRKVKAMEAIYGSLIRAGADIELKDREMRNVRLVAIDAHVPKSKIRMIDDRSDGLLISFNSAGHKKSCRQCRCSRCGKVGRYFKVSKDLQPKARKTLQATELTRNFA